MGSKFRESGFDPAGIGQYNRCCSGSPLAPADSHCRQVGQWWFWVASAVRTLSGAYFDRRVDAGHEDGQSPNSTIQTIPKDPEGAPHRT